MTSNELVLVTGGAGFIGTNLSLELMSRGYRLRIFDNFSQVPPEMVREALSEFENDRLEIIEGDIRDRECVQEAMDEVARVVHLAAYTNVPNSVEHPELDVENNSLGSVNVLESIRQTDTVQSLVFASSNAVVGEVEGAVDESRVPEPIAPYGASKLYGEALCSVYWNCYDIHTTSLRFANAYGPYSGHKTSVVAKFIRRAKRGKHLEIYGDGEQTRDFVHAGDIARVIGVALRADHDAAEVYQVATGRETRIMDLARWIRDIAHEHGIDIEIEHADPRPGEIRFNYSNIEKVNEELNWEPEYGLREQLPELWKAGGAAGVTADFEIHQASS